MHRPRTGIITLAALAAFATIAPGLVGAREVSVRRETPGDMFKRRVAERIVSTGGGSYRYYGKKRNGGALRKRKMLAAGVGRARC